MPSPIHCALYPVTTGDGNIYAVLARAERCLRHAQRREESGRMAAEVFAAGSYAEALTIVSRYVTLEPEDYL